MYKYFRVFKDLQSQPGFISNVNGCCSGESNSVKTVQNGQATESNLSNRTTVDKTESTSQCVTQIIEKTDSKDSSQTEKDKKQSESSTGGNSTQDIMVTAPNDKGDNSDNANNSSEVVSCGNVSESQKQDIASGQKTTIDKNLQLEYCKF